MVRDEPPPAPIGGRARAGQGHCDLCYFPDAREDSGVVICPHAIVCVRARNRRRKILALISVLIILGQDALTKCGSKETGGEPNGAAHARAGPHEPGLASAPISCIYNPSGPSVDWAQPREKREQFAKGPFNYDHENPCTDPQTS